MSSKFDQALVSTLLELSEVLASTDSYDEKMVGLCDRTRLLMDSDRCSIFLRIGEDCFAKFNSGNPPEIHEIFVTFKIPVSLEIIQQAFEQKKAVLINDAYNDPRLPKEIANTFGINAIIVAPLLSEDAPVGFITAEYNQHKGLFSELDATLLTGVARLAATMVESEALSSERAILDNRLSELQKFEPLGRLAGGLAHDFNNVLTIVLGYCDLIKLTESEADRAAYFESIENTLMRASNMSSQLLTFSKGGTSSSGSLDLSEAVSDLSPMLESLLPSTISLQTHLPPGPAWIFADSSEIVQVVMNLVLNARDSINGIGSISIKLSIEQPNIILQILDSGSGIEQDVIGQIFDPFFSTKDARGIGLGLSNVQAIVAKSDGGIEVDSARSGTTFTITLPEHEPGIKGTGQQKTSKIASRDHSITILLVDDQMDLLEVQSSWLKREGYNVLSTSDPMVAKAWMSEFGKDIDLLITDMLMPNVSGAELIDEAIAHDISDVLVISGYLGSEDFDLNRTDINLSYLQKPFRPSRLELAIVTALQHITEK